MWRELQAGDPELIGPYRLRGLLGSGGMGRVFLGVSAGGRPVAVKVIRADLAADAEFRTRFQREIEVARTVSGQFTAPVIDADLDAPVPWLATAYVPGPSLADAVRDHGPLPAAAVLRLAAGLAEGLCAIHAAGVVHRDLKPANVLLAEDGPRLIDFGISLGAQASALTRTGLVVGSPGFMSPEQAEGRDVGPASDIFSLGAVLTFAATGEGPFGTGSTPALVYRVVHAPPSLDHGPAELRPLISRCLAKDPAQRPTAVQLLAEAGAALPAAGWLPAPVTRTFLQVRAQADGEPTVTSLVPAPPAPSAAAAGQARHDEQESRPPRRRMRRPLAVAAVAAVILAASAVGGMTLTASAHHLPAPHAGHTGRAHMTMHAPQQTVRPTVMPTMTQMPGAGPTPAPTMTAAPAPTASATPTTTATPTMTATSTPTASATPTMTVAPTMTATPAATASVTPAAAATVTANPGSSSPAAP